jgi:hypothetical protein
MSEFANGFKDIFIKYESAKHDFLVFAVLLSGVILENGTVTSV